MGKNRIYNRTCFLNHRVINRLIMNLFNCVIWYNSIFRHKIQFKLFNISAFFPPPMSMSFLPYCFPNKEV